MVRRVARAVEGGVDLVQLRDKDLPGGELLALARELLRALEGRAPLVINERVDVAVAAGAQGVQLGEDALSVEEARKILPPQAWVGRSVHSVDGAIDAENAGADFLVVGTMFATGSHPGAVASGPELMRGNSRFLPGAAAGHRGHHAGQSGNGGPRRSVGRGGNPQHPRGRRPGASRPDSEGIAVGGLAKPRQNLLDGRQQSPLPWGEGRVRV